MILRLVKLLFGSNVFVTLILMGFLVSCASKTNVEKQEEHEHKVYGIESSMIR